MIIIKIIILYFIQIRHTDDFPSTGIPASNNNNSNTNFNKISLLSFSKYYEQKINFSYTLVGGNKINDIELAYIITKRIYNYP